MTRTLSIVGLALLVLLLLGGAVALLAYGPEPTRDGSLAIDGLDAEARVTWIGDAMPVIDAESEAGVWTALGYAHAADHAWAMALWRQAATGRLATWIGADGSDLDRHARQLAFGDVARTAYRALSPDDRAVVDAYARGVAAGFADPAVAERDELIRLGVELDPWEPWHALAIERMMAWIGTGPLADSSPADSSAAPAPDLSPEAVAFARADSAFRATLALGGFEHARAFSAPAREGQTVVVHQPYGASALPLLTGATVTFGGRTRTVGTVPGTLILASGGDEWAVLLTSTARLVPNPDPAPPPAYSRITGRDGEEALTEVLRDDRGLVLRARTGGDADTTASGDPAVTASVPGLRLAWSGYAPIADVGAWRALLRGESATFRLWRGDGLARRDGRLQPIGAPPVASTDTETVFVGGHPSSALAVRRFATLQIAEPRVSARALASDAGSPWSAAQIRPLLVGLGNRDSLSLELKDAYAFLRGWDGLYQPDAVAPTIAEAWIDAHRRVFDRDPDPRQRLDSLLVRQTLRLGLAHLRDSLGATAGTWTWERWGGPLRYPLASGGRFEPLASHAGGHPSALLPAPSLVLPGPPGPAVFTLWTVGGVSSTSRPSIRTGAPRDGRDPILTRLWRSPEADDSSLRLLPSR